MSNETLYDLPSWIRSGNSVSWTLSLSDYPASEGWTAKYNLVPDDGKNNSNILLTSTADDDDHAFEVTPTVSANWGWGSYVAYCYAENSGTSERCDVYERAFYVKINPVNATSADVTDQDTLILKQLKDAYVTLTNSPTMSSINVMGKSYTARTLDELRTDIARWEEKVLINRRAKKGLSPIRPVRITLR